MEQSSWTPKQIVAELNKYIVGQGDAKKSVAIALRNRWRRKRLSEEMQDEIIPRTSSSSARPVSVKQKSPAAWPNSSAHPSSRSKRRNTPKSATSAATSNR